MESTEDTLNDGARPLISGRANDLASPTTDDVEAVRSVPQDEPKTRHKDTEPTVSDHLRNFQDSTLKFFANASNETLGACAVGLCASTYLVLGRVGLVLIGTVGGIVLHATWENSLNSADRGEEGQGESVRKRKELSLEVAKRVLDWRDLRRIQDGGVNGERAEKIETWSIKEKLDYSAFRPATNEALTNFTDAVIRDYVKWWYGPILPQDESFPATCRQTLTGFVLSLSNHVSRKRTADPFLDFMANATSILIVFLNELSAAIRASPNHTVDEAIATYLEFSPDSNLANVLSVDQQQRKLNLVAEDILESFLESKSFNCAPVRAFLREVLSNLILQTTVNSCSKAEWINGWIVYMLEDGEPELLNVIDAGVENLGAVTKQVKAEKTQSAEDKTHQRRVSRAEEAMQEAMREAQRMNEMIAEEEARRQRGESAPEAEDTISTITTDPGIVTPVSELSDHDHHHDRHHETAHSQPITFPYQTDMVFDHEGNAMPSGANSPAKASSPLTNKSPPTSFDQLAPQVIPTALQPESTPPALVEVMVAVPLTLHNAAITVLDLGAGNVKSKIKSKPTDELLVQIEPASSRYSGWMASRKYVDFEALHETLRRIAVVSGVPEFGDQHATVPPWQGKTRGTLITDLESYLKSAVKHERLAESEAMKKFLEKDTGLSKIPPPNKNVLLQGAAALDNVGKGFINVLGQGGKGIAGGGKAVIGGVQGVFGAVGPKKSSAKNGTAMPKLTTNNISNPQLSQDVTRSSTEPSESRPSLVSRQSASSFEHIGDSSSPSQGSVSQEKLNLPPPPSEIADEYPGFHPTTSPRQISKPMMGSKEVQEIKASRPSTPTQGSKAAVLASPVIPEPASATLSVHGTLPGTPIEPASSPNLKSPQSHKQSQSKSDTKRAQPLTDEETRITVDLMFAIITSTYALSSAWTIRLSLLSAAKSFLLRPNNPQLESIRTLIQDSLISSNTTDAAIAAHVNKLRENSLPTEEELKKWPAPLDDKQREELRVKAKKLLVERGMPQALTSVMGQAASSEALGKVFDCLQIENVARGLIFALMLQAIRAVIQ